MVKKVYTVQVNDYMTPVKVELTDSEARVVAYVLEEIVKSDKDALVQIEEEDTGDILFDNYDDWIKADRRDDYKEKTTICESKNNFAIYVVKFSDGSYYIECPTQICLRKEDAKRMTWTEAEELRDEYIRSGRKDTVVEPA